MTPSAALTTSPGSGRRTSAPPRPAAEHPADGGREPELIRCAGTADFLAALPFLTGFTAENSLFVVLFSGRRASNSLRIDLPPNETPEVVVPLLDGICRLLEELGAATEGPAFVFTSEQAFAEAGGAPWRSFARMIRRRFKRRGWPLRELAVVAPDGWAAFLDPGSSGVRRPLSEIRASPVAVRAAEVVQPPARLEDLGRLPQPTPERAAAVLARLAELDLRAERRESAREAEAAAETAEGEALAGAPVWLHGAARVAGACFARCEDDRAPLEPRLCARLIRAAESPDQWLVLALTALTRPEFVIELAEEAPPPGFTGMTIDLDDEAGTVGRTRRSEAQRPPRGRSMRRLLHSLAQDPPEPEKLRRAIAALAEAAANAPEHRRPGLLALLAWAWWTLGMQSVAGRIAREALDIDPAHQVSLMVDRLVEEPPPWRFRADFAARGCDQR